jgi:hypothetical protein
VTGSGAGTNLFFSLWRGSIFLGNTTETFSYPAPSILPGSLQGPGASPSTYYTLTAPVTDGNVRVLFSGNNLYFDPKLVRAFYGPANNRFRYECAVDQFSSSTTAISCALAINTIGIRNTFTVSVFGVNATGTDLLHGQFTPSINLISGCAVAGCNTSGGQILTIGGDFFIEPVQVSVGGVACTSPSWDNSVAGSHKVNCTLAAGVGVGLPVVVTAAGSSSLPTIGVSYAAPVITQITGCPPNGCFTNGTNVITITGYNLGSSASSVLVGSSKSMSVSHTVPHFQLTASVPPGFGIISSFPLVSTNFIN